MWCVSLFYMTFYWRCMTLLGMTSFSAEFGTCVCVMYCCVRHAWHFNIVITMFSFLKFMKCKHCTYNVRFSNVTLSLQCKNLIHLITKWPTQNNRTWCHVCFKQSYVVSGVFRHRNFFQVFIRCSIIGFNSFKGSKKFLRQDWRNQRQ